MLCLVGLLGGAATGWAQPEAMNFTRSLWRAQDGLPESIVQAATQTRDGYLWVGTTGGLARFDGSQFMTFPLWRNPAAVIPVNSVFSLLSASDGSLWAGTEGGGLLRFRGGQIDSYAARQGLADPFIRAILEDKSGRIWVGSDNGLFRMAGSRLERVDTAPGMRAIAVHSIAEDHLHRIWVGGSSLLMFDAGGAHTLALAGAYSQNRVKTITETRDGTLWVGTVGGLQRRPPEGGSFVPVPELRGATVRTLRQTRDGTLWIGTIGHGLWTWRGGRFEPFSNAGLLPSNTVLSICEDADGQIWLGTQDGLVRLSRTPVSVVPLPGGSDPDFETISCDTDGSLWVAGSSVYRIREGVAQPYVFAALPGVGVRNVFRAAGGDLWVGTDGSGAYRFAPGKAGPVHYRAPGELPNNFVRAFLQTAAGDTWIATDEGVTRLGPHGAVRYGVREGLVYFSTRALFEDAQHDVWIGTDQGLSHWHAGAFVHDEATEALAQEKVWAIHQDREGTLWFGTRDHGLWGYRGAAVAQVTTAQGLPGNSIYQLLEDRGGRIWLSGPGGLYSVNEGELDRLFAARVAGEPGEPLNVVAPPMPFGADGAQLYGGRQPAGCVDRANRIWFPSSKGAVYVSTARGSPGSPPAVMLAVPRVDGRTAEGGGALRLDAHASRVELSFGSLLLRPQSGVNFRYRLEGFDKRWTAAGHLRTATYTNLPAGHYRFRVAAFLPDNPGHVSEAELRFEKEPYLYQRWWFLALCATVLCAGAWGIYTLRMQQIRGRFEAVLAERSRLAREMHDTVIQGCTGVSALLEAVASFRMVEGSAAAGQAPGDDLLSHARTQIRTTIDEAREAVWNLRHGNERAHDLAASLAAIAGQMAREFQVPVECTSKGPAFLLRDSGAHELLMVVREAVYNAALHGRPRRIAIHTTYGRQWLSLRVEDDGCGFAPEESDAVLGNGTHYGLTGMRERVERLGGRLHLRSAPGAGATLEFSVRRSVLAAGTRGKTTSGRGGEASG